MAPSSSTVASWGPIFRWRDCDPVCGRPAYPLGLTRSLAVLKNAQAAT